MPSQTIEDVRREIDAIDDQIVTLLSERARRAERLARLKFDSNLDARSTARERVVLERVHGLNRGPLSNDALDAIYGTIIETSYALQAETIKALRAHAQA